MKFTMENNPSFKKITSSIALENFSILTDTGFEKVNKLHKTVPYEIYELKLFNGKVLRCADNHIVFYINHQAAYAITVHHSLCRGRRGSPPGNHRCS